MGGPRLDDQAVPVSELAPGAAKAGAPPTAGDRRTTTPSPLDPLPKVAALGVATPAKSSSELSKRAAKPGAAATEERGPKTPPRSKPSKQREV